jgi:hypothetical protein
MERDSLVAELSSTIVKQLARQLNKSGRSDKQLSLVLELRPLFLDTTFDIEINSDKAAYHLRVVQRYLNSGVRQVE